MQEVGGLTDTRLTVAGTVVTELAKSGRISSLGRMEIGGIFGLNRSSYFGGEFGFSYELGSGVAVSGGYYNYGTFGQHLFLADQFISNRGYAARFDYLKEHTKVSAMWRYEPGRGWFDQQFRISQVIGCFEPVFVSRLAPRDYQLGLTFRISDAIKKLQGVTNKDNERGKP
jgi:hypothetical protein